MKKIKLMLLFLLIIAFASGFLAFKVKDSNRTFYSLDSSDGFCSVPISLPRTTAFGTCTYTQLSTTAAAAQGPCPLVCLKISA